MAPHASKPTLVHSIVPSLTVLRTKLQYAHVPNSCAQNDLMAATTMLGKAVTTVVQYFTSACNLTCTCNGQYTF